MVLFSYRCGEFFFFLPLRRFGTIVWYLYVVLGTRGKTADGGQPLLWKLVSQQTLMAKTLMSVDTESRQHTRMRSNTQEIVKTIWTSDALADRSDRFHRPVWPVWSRAPRRPRNASSGGTPSELAWLGLLWCRQATQNIFKHCRDEGRKQSRVRKS